MKTAIYIEDGVAQLVLTPDKEFEKTALDGFLNKPLNVHVKEGSFYECHGGFIRQSTSDRSLILTVRAEENK
ncbi:hypothetical protein LCGC14_1548300 [marine sediment metagenome]|uniref:Uncharacterized protein n=1 Tax=marine sediment metagenome TaxID=412755 RepID=A0A0F9JC23_9ZZZZ